MKNLNFDEAQMWRRLSDNAGNYYCKLAEPEREEFRKLVKSLLHEGQITVEFEKANGETRAMICTLNEEKGAKYVVNENKYVSGDGTSEKRINNDVCAVWDCTQMAWRSFRWDRLKKVEYSLG